MTERDRIQRERQSSPDGPRVGLVAFDMHDPQATLRPIEPVQPESPPASLRVRALLWALRILVAWLVNLVALALAGLIVTNVGSDDPFAYVAWAALLGLVNAAGRHPARFDRGWRAVVGPAALLLAANLVMVWLMTLVARPSHVSGLASIVQAGAVTWLANLPLRLLHWRRATTG